MSTFIKLAWLALAVSLIEGLSIMAGQVSTTQLWLAIGFPLMLPLCLLLPARPVARSFFVLALGLACLALFQASWRGTHRWCTLGEWRINTALPLVIATVLATATTVSTVRKLLLTAISTVVLVVSSSFSAALLLVATVVCTSPGIRQQRRAWLATVALTMLVAVSILATPNRSRRLAQYLSGSGYQTAQVRKAVSSVSLIGSSSAGSIHLPARKTDFALLDIATRYGGLAVIALLASYAAIVAGLMRMRRSLPPPADQLIRSAATVIGLALAFHFLVNLSLVPPLGMPAPFLGAGLSANIAFKIAFGICMASACRATLRSTAPGNAQERALAIGIFQQPPRHGATS